jgi:hypothetical protein
MLTNIHVSLSSESNIFKTNGILGFVGLQHSYYLDFQVSKAALVAAELLHIFCPYFPVVLLGRSKLDKCLAGQITTLQVSLLKFCKETCNKILLWCCGLLCPTRILKVWISDSKNFFGKNLCQNEKCGCS